MEGQEQELTLLFYIASDNALAPLVVSEIKAIKDAGFQKDTTVLVYFDPLEKGARTQLLDINNKRKNARRTNTFIGDGQDPFVRNVSEDEVDRAELTPGMIKSLDEPTTVKAVDSLKNFIEFALEKRKANNYMLFTIGHGMIVGNDTFLPDDNPVSGITLKQLKELCEPFTQNNQTSLRLLGLHSCSMSSIEVAYELKGKADYMLATQGTMFVNGWPYRQLLKKILKHVDRAKERAANGVVDYEKLLKKLHFLCLFNFTDFMTAGYSCDLSLISLNDAKINALKDPLQRLIAVLSDSLPRLSLVKDLVLLAHCEAQSFWSENYTDLWDFCDCLKRHCEEMSAGLTELGVGKSATDELANIAGLSQLVKDALASGDRGRGFQGVVRYADNCGSEFQYARGLSIYFPWSAPLDDRLAAYKRKQNDMKTDQREAKSKTVLENYEAYDFTMDFKPSWLGFLNAYFERTMREPRPYSGSVFNDFVTYHPNAESPTAGNVHHGATDFTEVLLKRTPELKRTPDVGGDCTCPSIKNFPIKFSITPGALKAFSPIGNQDEEREDE